MWRVEPIMEFLIMFIKLWYRFRFFLMQDRAYILSTGCSSFVYLPCTGWSNQYSLTHLVLIVVQLSNQMASTSAQPNGFNTSYATSDSGFPTFIFLASQLQPAEGHITCSNAVMPLAVGPLFRRAISWWPRPVWHTVPRQTGSLKLWGCVPKGVFTGSELELNWMACR